MQRREDHLTAQQPPGGLQRDRLPLEQPAAVSLDGDLNGLVAGLPQPGGDRGGRAQRDLVLARGPAAEDSDPHGVTGGATPTEMLTVSPRWPREPPGGNSEITLPTSEGSSVCCSVMAGTKPACFRAVTADLRSCPTTLGTEIAPLETKIVT